MRKIKISMLNFVCLTDDQQKNEFFLFAVNQVQIGANIYSECNLKSNKNKHIPHPLNKFINLLYTITFEFQ